MSGILQPPSFFIGWDVGGWNCDKNDRSRDAIVILDANRDIVGRPWRGNLRTTINEAENTCDWLESLFLLCETNLPAEHKRTIMAIDAPLGFSEAFTQLVIRLECEALIGQSDTNPYLFRHTEQFLFDHGLRPLSAIKDMIGSQATKGMHVLARFAPQVAQCGAWTDGDILTAIEAYPSACKDSALFQELLKRYLLAERIEPPMRQWSGGIDHQDKLDALTCALIAYAFTFQPDTLAHPAEPIPITEGWIWAPKDALRLRLVEKEVLHG
ncbi:MAG: hypothetical protein A3H31_05665 [Gallionellales bacterium RIFCSPLOWO2_02_FULL_57_47]|nr:MAG: hypothetical protein A3H31_05665 [Gallionellales bacterium RIFCSPLOWO2_02_FULL_57_47]OGT13602.1 MAG: hypothetical protein A3J49_04425 [Gallionellales bacterium RIFCSPHIGHO2_02_FULL_57_16]